MSRFIMVKNHKGKKIWVNKNLIQEIEEDNVPMYVDVNGFWKSTWKQKLDEVDPRKITVQLIIRFISNDRRPVIIYGESVARAKLQLLREDEDD